MAPRILVVDDNKDSLELSRRILELDEYDVMTAQSADEAVAILRDHPVHLVLLDYLLQDMEGREFLRNLETQLPHLTENTPVVFFTAYNQLPSDVKAAGYISKSIDLDDFLATVRKFLNLPNEGRTLQ